MGHSYENGKLHIDGIKVINPHEVPYARLNGNDYQLRGPGDWIRQIYIHTTKGIHPQLIRPGVGPGGKDKVVSDFWNGSADHSAAQIVIDNDGSILILCDLKKIAAYHATTANAWSIGIEMYQEADGSIYQCVLDSCVKLVLALCDIFGIPLQGSAVPYEDNKILTRLQYGGPDVVGVFGHREQAWKFAKHLPTSVRAKYPLGYAARGRGDPGDEIGKLLRHNGMITFDIDRKAETIWWASIQVKLNKMYGLTLMPDGICGPSTVRALRDNGLWNGGIFTEAPI